MDEASPLALFDSRRPRMPVARTHLRNEVLRPPRPVIWVSRWRKSERWVVVVVVVVVVIVGDLGWSCVNAVRRFHS